ncbi:MAG TPA: pitrilysin family protein [Bacteroidales bacterium]|nr:pitrilysin family protein [Bacteroidales bacterium]
MTTRLNRKIQPAIQPPGKVSFPKPEIYQLTNGIKVYQFNTGTQDVISVELVFTAGSWFQQKPFTAMATNLMLREGTQNYSAQKLSESLDYYGAHFENTTERDNAYVNLYSLNKHLGNTLPLLSEIVKNPIFPEQEFRIVAGKQLQQLEVNRQKVNFLARTHFNSIIFGNTHPYGMYLQPNDIGNITTNDLGNFHKQRYHSNNCFIIAAGRIRPGLKNELEAHFGGDDWSGNAGLRKQQQPSGSAEMNHFIPKEGAIQSAIRMGRLMFSSSHPDFAGVKVLNAILGGYFGSRLMNNLREDKGYTYGIGSSVVPLQDGGYFVISGEVGADVTKDALSEIKKELSRLCNEPVNESELSLVRSYMTGEMLRAVDGPFAQADLYRELIENNLGIIHFEEMMDTIQHITAQQLQDLAIRYLDPEKLHTLVVGPEQF